MIGFDVLRYVSMTRFKATYALTATWFGAAQSVRVLSGNSASATFRLSSARPFTASESSSRVRGKRLADFSERRSGAGIDSRMSGLRTAPPIMSRMSSSGSVSAKLRRSTALGSRPG
jgi:hypothetical protein